MIRTYDEEYAADHTTPSVAVPSVDSLRFARRLLRMLVALNWLVGTRIVALLFTSVVAEPWLMHALGMRPAPQHSSLATAARLIMLVGIVATPMTHVVLTRLQRIVDTVREGSPFAHENAARLRTIAWAVLGLELLHLSAGLRGAAART